MRRRGVGAIASSPVLVGAITTLIVILAVFLAYNANNGLPFVPSYRISVQVPNAETLVKGNDVRIGGVRVGFVESVEPVQDPQTGAVHAKADLKLDKSVDPLPKDSTVVVRSRSALGLKYLEIDKGTSKRGLSRGLDPAAEGRPPAPGRDRPGPEHLRRAHPERDPAEPGRLRRRARRPRAGAERGPRRAPAAGHAPGAGGAQPRLAEDRARALLPRAGRQRGRGGARGRDPGPDVRLPGHDLRRLRRRWRARSSRRRSPRRRRPSTR